MKHLFLIGLMAITGCSFKKNPLANQTNKGHEELYSEPEAPKLKENENIKRIVIAATNDIEGHYKPQKVVFKDEHNRGTQQTLIGGADAMAAYFEILREEYKNVLLVDAGDIFSSKVNRKKVQKFYESNKYDALTVGLNDFNLKLPKGIQSSAELFKDFAKKTAVPLVLSNLYELKTGRVVEWKGTFPYLLKEAGGVKVGIIGLIPDDIVNLTPVDSRVALFVENMIQSTLRQARLLRSLGADIIVVLTHQGMRCGHELAQEAKLPLAKVNFEPNRPDVCEKGQGLAAYLERLPPHLVDVVIGGRTHEKMANYVNETLVLSNFEHGKSMIYAEFFVDKKSGKVLKDQTVVHQPVMFCREFFKETNDCYTGDPSVDHSKRTPAKFLGKELILQSVEKKVSLRASETVDLNRALRKFSADLAFAPKTSRNSQLILFKLSGKALIHLLEEDFNSSLQENWHPSPFSQSNEKLHLKINGEAIVSERNYLIVADLEGAQASPKLSKYILHQDSRSLSAHSWASFEIQDSVNTALSSIQH